MSAPAQVPDEGEIRKEFDKWAHMKPHTYLGTNFLDWSTDTTWAAYLAAARKYGAETERLRWELAVSKAEHLNEIDNLNRAFEQRDDARSDAKAEAALREQAEAALAGKNLMIGLLQDQVEIIRSRRVPTPAPLDEARREVVEAAMAEWELAVGYRDESSGDMDELSCRTGVACGRLRALQAPADPVREARVAIDRAYSIAADSEEFMALDYIRTARALLDSALAASERKP